MMAPDSGDRHLMRSLPRSEQHRSERVPGRGLPQRKPVTKARFPKRSNSRTIPTVEHVGSAPYHNCSVETADAANTATTLTSTAAATAATIATGRRRSHSAVKTPTAAPAQAAGDELLDIDDAILQQITDPSTVRALEFVGVTQFDLLAQRGQGKVRIGSSQCHCYAQPPLVGETRRHPHIGHNQIRTVLGDSRFQFRGMDSACPRTEGKARTRLCPIETEEQFCAIRGFNRACCFQRVLVSAAGDLEDSRGPDEQRPSTGAVDGLCGGVVSVLRVLADVRLQ